MNRKSPENETFVPSGFFVMRTPLLPFSEYVHWGGGLRAASQVNDLDRLPEALTHDRRLLRSRLQGIVDRDEVREAIFVASPSLHARIDAWKEDPDEKKVQKIEQSICRYFSRMTRRPTPFGLFAGCSVGEIADATRIRLTSMDQYRRHTRLDMEYLFALSSKLEQDAKLRRVIRFFPNSTIYDIGERLRYAESRFDGNLRMHNLVAVDASDELLATLSRAKHGVQLSTLASELTNDEIEQDEAEAFIEELVDHQLLVSELQPPVTGDEGMQAMIRQLCQYSETSKEVDCLKQVGEELEQLDRLGLGQPADRYKTIATQLEKLPAPVNLPRLFQVDMVKPSDTATLGTAVVADVQRGLEILQKLAPSTQNDAFTTFRSDFSARYGDQTVPLVEVLDEESGIGFLTSNEPSAAAAPLLAGILFPQNAQTSENWEPRHAILLNKLTEVFTSGSHELRLSESDIDEIASNDPVRPADAVVAMGTLVADSAEDVNEGNFRFLLRAVSGPSGARLLGRFCQGDAELRRHVERHLREEEALVPDAIFAEVVHLPEGRTGNILSRPLLRRFEIPFLGRSGAPEDAQISIGDLMVSIESGRVVLHSRKLGREVIPRLTSAHNYVSRSLGIYKFLCALQNQGVTGHFAWSWGPLEACPFLPRVTVGRLVLTRARWSVSAAEIARVFSKTRSDLFVEVQRWRAERRLPRYVAVKDGDNELPIDLENVLSIETFANLVKGRSFISLVELFPENENCIEGPEGRFAHEMLIPFVRKREPVPAASVPTISGRASQKLAPGSDWLYFNIYSGVSTSDRVLLDCVRGVAHQALQTGAVDHWFFIRYNDPDNHIRVRFHGDPSRLPTEVAPLFYSGLQPFQNADLVWKVQQDTYQREVNRYGGDEAILHAEKIFQFDSEAALSLIDVTLGDAGLNARWMLTLLGMHQLLLDFQFDQEDRRRIACLYRDGFAEEFGFTKFYKQQLGQKYRVLKRSLEPFLDGNVGEDEVLAYGLSVMKQRSERVQEFVAELRQLEARGQLTVPLFRIATCFLHMHVNRVLPTVQRAHEMVLYDFLSRFYESQAARLRRAQQTKV